MGLTRILNLGCGQRPIKAGEGQEVVNHDLRRHRPEVNVAHDLNLLPWPWPDDSFEVVLASSVFEHLEIDLVRAMDECWRILRPGGCLRVKLPHWQHDNAWADPTHRWRYTSRSLDVFVPETKLGQELAFYTARKWAYLQAPKLNDQKSSVAAILQARKEVTHG